LKIIRMLIMILSSIFLVSITPLGLFSHSMNQTILKPYSTVDYMKDSGMLEDIRQIIPGMIQIDVPQEYTEQDAQMIQEAILEVVHKHATEEWIYDRLTFMQTEIWDYILQKDDRIEGLDVSDITVPFLVELKEKFTAKYPEVPKVLIEERLKEYEQYIAKKLNWAGLIGMETERLDALKTNYSNYKNVNLWLNVSIILAIVLSVLVIFHVTKIFRWFGMVGIMISGIVLTLYAAWTFFDKEILYSKIQLPAAYKDLESSMIELIELASGNFFSHLAWSAFTVLIPGILLLIIGFIIKKRQSLDTQQAQ
jgi:hypothetical protein